MYRLGFASGSVVKNPPANAEDTCLIPGLEDPLDMEVTTHSSILAWEIPWTEEPSRLPGMLQSTGLQRVRTSVLLNSNSQGIFKHCENLWSSLMN